MDRDEIISKFSELNVVKKFATDDFVSRLYLENDYLTKMANFINSKSATENIIFKDFKTLVAYIHSQNSKNSIFVCMATIRLLPTFKRFLYSRTGELALADFLTISYQYTKRQKLERLCKYILNLMNSHVPYFVSCYTILLKENILRKQTNTDSAITIVKFGDSEIKKVHFPLPLAGEKHKVLSQDLNKNSYAPTILMEENCLLSRQGRMIAGINKNNVLIDELHNEMGKCFSVDKIHFNECNYIDEPVFWPGDQFSVNAYAHFLFDYLPRLLLWKQQKIKAKIIIDKPLYPYFDSIIKHIGLDDSIIEYPLAKNVRFKKLYFMNTSARDFIHPFQFGHSSYNKVITKFVNSLVKNNVDTPERLYLTRRNERGRKLENENILIGFLEANGFTIVDAGLLTFENQVAYFNNAKFIIGIHGGAFTNLMFSPESIKVLELFPSTGGSNDFAVLCMSKNIDYSYIKGENIDNFSLNSAASNVENVHLDIDKFKHIIERWLID